MRAAVTAGSPLPVAISRTRSPASMRANSTSREFTPCALLSKLGHHFFHPAADSSQLRRWSCLRLAASGIRRLSFHEPIRVATQPYSALRRWEAGRGSPFLTEVENARRPRFVLGGWRARQNGFHAKAGK